MVGDVVNPHGGLVNPCSGLVNPHGGLRKTKCGLVNLAMAVGWLVVFLLVGQAAWLGWLFGWLVGWLVGWLGSVCGVGWGACVRACVRVYTHTHTPKQIKASQTNPTPGGGHNNKAKYKLKNYVHFSTRVFTGSSCLAGVSSVAQHGEFFCCKA